MHLNGWIDAMRCDPACRTWLDWILRRRSMFREAALAVGCGHIREAAKRKSTQRLSPRSDQVSPRSG